MRFYTLLLAFLLSIHTFAQLNGDGYYRVQNNHTKRYVYITDDKGSINLATTSADMNAIQLYLDFEKAASDPATICYIKNIEGRLYDIQAQGTGIYDIIDYYISIIKKGEIYRTYATYSGVTKYLGDGEAVLTNAKGVLSTETSGNFRDWNIIPVTLNDDSYLGVKPTVSHNNTYYQPYFTSFPYSLAGENMRAFYINKVDKGMAVYKEITGVIPAKTAVFIQCASDKAINNKLNVGGSAAKLNDNLLKGVYFNRTGGTKHTNRTPYDPETMRIIGITKAGKLGFIKASIDYLPANQAYLTVPSGTEDELTIVSEEEYKKTAGVSEIKSAETENSDVYTLTGTFLGKRNTLKNLAPGVYIIGKKKVIIR